MKKLLLSAVVLSLLLFPKFLNAHYDENLEKDPIFMEEVYNFIDSADLSDVEYISDEENISYCEEIYLEATRRRDYTQEEENLCGELFDKKNQEEISYKKYMLNNRELFNQ